MKDKIINFFKKDLKYLLVNLKNLIIHLFKEKKIQSLIVCGILIIIIVIVIITAGLNKNRVNNAGRNLANMGFTTENGKYIYYLGYDDGSVDGIYKIKKNGKDAEKMNSEYAIYLNSDGKYIYYLDYDNEDIVKMKSNGKDKQTLAESVDLTTVSLYDNYIYYIKNSNLYKIKTNGKDNVKLLNKSIYSYEINNGWVYYTYYIDGEYVLAKISAKDGNDKVILEKKAGRNFFIRGNDIYYMYEDTSLENGTYEYQLCKIKNDGSGEEKIAILQNIDVGTLNTDGKKLYYAKTNEEGIYSIYSVKLNGKDETKLVDVQGTRTYINVIDGYIYYPDNDEEENTSLFRIKTSGGERQKII